MIADERLNALKPGEKGRWYLVGTFPDERGRKPRAYLRDYKPGWSGCIEYYVMAGSGREAKRAAIEARQPRGQKKGGSP